jgi:hypothetical protein
MLLVMPRTLGQALSIRGVRRTDGPGRLMVLCALAGAAMIAAAVVLFVRGDDGALLLGAVGAVVQAGGFLVALWWATRRLPPRCDRRRS